ncbi:hypothetical protein Bca4012_097636 [Brassica carinata]
MGVAVLLGSVYHTQTLFDWIDLVDGCVFVILQRLRNVKPGELALQSPLFHRSGELHPPSIFLPKRNSSSPLLILFLLS